MKKCKSIALVTLLILALFAVSCGQAAKESLPETAENAGTIEETGTAAAENAANMTLLPLHFRLRPVPLSLPFLQLQLMLLPLLLPLFFPALRFQLRLWLFQIPAVCKSVLTDGKSPL